MPPGLTVKMMKTMGVSLSTQEQGPCAYQEKNKLSVLHVPILALKVQQELFPD